MEFCEHQGVTQPPPWAHGGGSLVPKGWQKPPLETASALPCTSESPFPSLLPSFLFVEALNLSRGWSFWRKTPRWIHFLHFKPNGYLKSLYSIPPHNTIHKPNLPQNPPKHLTPIPRCQKIQYPLGVSLLPPPQVFFFLIFFF